MDLAETVQSPERLKLLLVLTVADMRAVSPRVWNGWKATLLREIYARVAEVLAGGLSTTERDVRVKRAKDAQAGRGADDTDNWSRMRTVPSSSALGYPGYWLSASIQTRMLRHARMVRDAEARARAADGGNRTASCARRHRSDGVRRRPCRPVQPHRRRARRRRRVHRRCAHPYADERHGAGYILGAGRRRRRVRPAAPAGQSSTCWWSRRLSGHLRLSTRRIPN